MHACVCVVYSCMCVCARARMCVYVCVRVCERTCMYARTHNGSTDFVTLQYTPVLTLETTAFLAHEDSPKAIFRS